MSSRNTSSSGTPDAVLNFPPEWLEGTEWLPGFPEVVQAVTYDKLPGEKFFIAGGVVEGGANLIGLAWSSGGQHVARCGPPLWAVEERVDPNAHPATRTLWRQVVASMIQGYREARGGQCERGSPSPAS